jgi:hypothetical protein
MHMSADHFKGKSVVDHLMEARAKGASASSEVHGVEIPGHWAAGVDALKETSISLLLLWIVLGQSFLSVRIILLFSAGWLLWKMGRSAFLGWARLERLHRLIEEERWEIEHHREQEREELTELYRAKGFTGKMLEEVIDVLMADDNRLLKVMLEEELGLSLEEYEHPLKQSLGAGVGVIIASGLLLVGFLAHPLYGIPIIAMILIPLATGIASVLENNRVLPAVTWTLSITFLSSAGVYFLSQLW